MKRIGWIIVFIGLIFGCDEKESPPTFVVTSPSFSDGQTIPRRYSCYDENISPALVLTEVPEETRTFAIIVEDPDAKLEPFVHWLIWGIPGTTMVFDEGFAATLVADQSPEATTGIRQGPNGDGDIGYMGPCPPSGEEHRYFFQVYALSSDLDLTPAAASDAQTLRAAMSDSIIGEGELMGYFKQ